MRASYRTVGVTGLIAMCATGATGLGAGGAFAAPGAVGAPASANIALDSCNMTVGADVGDHLVVSVKTMLAPQMKDLGNIPYVGPMLVGSLEPALSTLTLPPFVVKQGRAPVTGAAIADALVTALGPVLSPPAVEPLRTSVTQACLITVVPKPVPGAGQVPAPTPGTHNALPLVGAPGTTSSQATTTAGSRQAPQYTYGDLTSVPAGGTGYSVGVAPVLPPALLSGYGLPSVATSAVPGVSTPLAAPAPQFGVLGAPASSTPATESPEVTPISGMSEVTALPAVPDTTSSVPAAAVLAALMLSLTTAALVRTWVLRRGAS